MNNTKTTKFVGVLTVLIMAVGAFSAQAELPSEGSRLGPRILQADLEGMSLDDIRKEGRRIFSTPFNFADGLGDGPVDPIDPTVPGGRPSLQGQGFLLRFNGNDSQTCLECHSVRSNASIPASFAVGGVGGVVASAFPGLVDPNLRDGHVPAGRIINPPFSFGSGGIELLAKEMTTDLQDLRQQALDNPNVPVILETKGISFGSIIFQDGVLNISGIEGVQPDLVVRPFGRKGCCFSVRDFDRGAMQFHHGMQPEEVMITNFGDPNFDGDLDGVTNEVTIGEMSALHIFQVALERPKKRGHLDQQQSAGKTFFSDIGCAGCHIPKLTTNSDLLPVAFPEVPTDPNANVFRYIDLSKDAPGFKERKNNEGVKVPLFADLKTHDMGSGLAESTGAPDAAFFTTARLWGVADTAPYLHDGRALTLSAAILAHGGEAQDERNNFAGLSIPDQEALVAYLRTLHTPRKPSEDLE